MREWLIWFQHRIGQRQVALILHNFSADECAVAELQDENAIPNIIILWLPPRTTTKYQPMDQGIIRAWKAHYRRSMMRYVI